MNSTAGIRHYVGIDVAGSDLDVCTLPSEAAARYTNDSIGIEALVASLASTTVALVVLEATGKLEIPVAAALSIAGIAVAIVNPRQVRDFAKATGQLAKTDTLDAHVLAAFARDVHPEARPVRDEQSLDIQDVLARRRQLIGMLAAEKNRLARARPASRKDILAHIAWLDKRLGRADTALKDIIKASPLWRERDALFQSVPGVGPVLSRTLLIDLPEIGNISHKAIAKLVGVAPLNRDSGTMRGSRGIWGGRAHVRSALYMATVIGTRYNPVLKVHYLKLRAEGKKPKVALVACMRKLLCILNAMAASGKPWNPEANIS